MKITIVAVGSEGDVRPYVALGEGLRINGHTIRFATDHAFEAMVASRGLEFARLSGNIRAWAHAGEPACSQKAGNPVSLARHVSGLQKNFALNWGHEVLAASCDADCLIAGATATWFGASIAEKLDIPCIHAWFLPLAPTREFVSPLIQPRWLAGSANVITHRLIIELFWQALRPGVNAVRERILDLPPWPLRAPIEALNDPRLPIVCGYSPWIVPKPKDWPDRIEVTGYWFLNSEKDWRPDPRLVDFLSSGSKPVYVGFGSMVTRNAEMTTDIVLDALAMCGQRAILVSGWGGLGERELPDNVIMIDSAPHEWLFPLVSVAVHHGGAGTTGAALRAGIPSVVVPFSADQAFWGHRLESLGCSPATIPRNRLTTLNLADAIDCAITDTRIHSAAADLGIKVQAENGVQRAIEIIEETLDRISSCSARASDVVPAINAGA